MIACHIEKVSTSHLLFHFQNKVKTHAYYKLLVVILRNIRTVTFGWGYGW